MAFVRKKKVGDREYAQIVENYRVEGVRTPRQRVLLHLGYYGPAHALIYWQHFADQSNRETTRQHYAAKVARLRELIEQGKVEVSDEDLRQAEQDLEAELRALEEIEKRIKGHVDAFMAVYGRA